MTELVGMGLGAGVGDAVGVGIAVGFGITVTPLFQTSFLPLLTHVYFLPPDVEVAPSFEHVAPALTAALATLVRSVNDTNIAKKLNLFLKESSQCE